MLTENGASEYQIVLGAGATACEQYAASEFQKYVEQITGVKLRIVSEAYEPIFADSKIISIGNTDMYRSQAFPNKSKLSGDGFMLKTVNGSLYIKGANDRGTLYGVYEFLETVCGVRFLDIHTEYVPTAAEISFKDMDEVKLPAFDYRVSLTAMVYQNKIVGASVEDQLAYAAKIRATSEFLPDNPKYGGTIDINKEKVNQVHNNLTYVIQGANYAEFVKENPTVSFAEFLKKNPSASYAEFVKANPNCESMFYFGREKTKQEPRNTPYDICYTNGIINNKGDETDGSIASGFNTASAYVEGLKLYITLNPHADYYVLGQEDIPTCCVCDSCKAISDRYGDDVEHLTRPSNTAAVIRFYNAVAREIQAWADEELGGKKINIVIFSYYFSRKAPVTLVNGEYAPMDETVVLADNIIVRFGVITANFSDSFLDENSEYNEYMGYSSDYLEQWKPLMSKCWSWDYTSNHSFYFGWVNAFDKLTTSLQGLAEANCEYAFIQYNNNEYNDWRTVMDNYVASKLLWDPYQDADALRNEFIELYYGVAAEDVKAIVDALDAEYAAKVKALDKVGEVSGKYYYMITSEVDFDTEFWMDILDRIESAEAKVAAQTGKSAEQIAEELTRIRRIYLTPLYSLVTFRDTHFTDEAEKAEYTKQFFDLCEEFGVQWYGEHRSIDDVRKDYFSKENFSEIKAQNVVNFTPSFDSKTLNAVKVERITDNTSNGDNFTSANNRIYLSTEELRAAYNAGCTKFTFEYYSELKDGATAQGFYGFSVRRNHETQEIEVGDEVLRVSAEKVENENGELEDGKLVTGKWTTVEIDLKALFSSESVPSGLSIVILGDAGSCIYFRNGKVR